MQTIAFIGLGHMGAPMAANLIKAGYLLRVFDLVQSAIDGLVVQGASAARSAHDAVDGADVVVTMLPASGHVEGLYLGNEGLLAHIAPGTLVLECSTIAPASRGYSGGFMTSLMTKDLGLALETAQVSGNSTPMGSLALALYRLLVKQGRGEQDFSVVQKLFDN